MSEIRSSRSGTTPRALPPGQRRVEGFPRFGTHLQRPAPQIPVDPVIEVHGAVEVPVRFRVQDLAELPRSEIMADFHCVAGWSATDLSWAGVRFRTFYEQVIAPGLRADQEVTHLATVGLDGYRCVMTLEDALGEDVLIADTLDGRPLGSDHGAPARFVSPSQYGYVSTKHLSGIELLTGTPDENFGAGYPLARLLMRRPLFARHPRSRVALEERNGQLPTWLIRPVYRAFVPAIRRLSARGAEQADRSGGRSMEGPVR
ncbi:MAG: hypothetical protein AVDCRST_MAG47-2250 [uncultured Nocardioidaceae bacterium]|uniref:Oxidoreductase molybdopterin-binding domain-containing protein n=1 Tax=uncultured Nocardioidaceae bacterium TaxID=253824 RepID=A0A6J4NGI6_9ACTN|nr:MAG: hypothetical protein AVDCRST_MAG47-2250 [uncultured Nocardioidaceae bacterium]